MNTEVVYSDSMVGNLRRRNTRENTVADTGGLRKGPLLSSSRESLQKQTMKHSSNVGVFNIVQQAGIGGMFRTASEPKSTTPAQDESPEDSSTSNSSSDGGLRHYNSLSSLWSKVNVYLPDLKWSSTAAAATSAMPSSTANSGSDANASAAATQTLSNMLPRSSSSSSSDDTRLYDAITPTGVTATTRTDLMTSSRLEGTSSVHSHWVEDTVFLYTPTAAEAATGGAESAMKAGLVHRNKVKDTGKRY